MAEFRESQELHDIALKLVSRIDRVGHINVNDILFLEELETEPKSLARCFIFGDHPIAFFTGKLYCIVRYMANTEYMSQNQLVILVLHELMHIPILDINRAIDHDIKDFAALMRINPEWARDGAEVPDILGDYNERIDDEK